ncbi:hypothetical protein AAH991_40040, partial [Microbispora sp. ZYX-F-249]
MKRTLALGGIAAGLLAAAAVAAPAQADTDVAPPVNLANTNFAAKQVAAFWYGQGKANLINATPYNVETTVPSKHVSTGGASADSKAGVVGSSGDQKATTSNLKNVNLPKTTGKVFFIGADNKPHWCSATAVQSQYKNLVATAGHCVYDTVSNKATLDKWVFIPGYYEGKTPWGIYVGKTAYTHYDYDVYEDGDRDYAFVTVYNGVQVTGASVDKVKNWVKDRRFETKAEAEKARKDLELKTTGWAGEIEAVKDPWHFATNKKESWKKAVAVPDFLKCLAGGQTKADAEALVRGASTEWTDRSGRAGIVITRVNRQEFGNGGDHWSSDDTTFYFTKDNGFYKATFWALFDIDYKLRGKIVDIALKDVGSLG